MARTYRRRHCQHDYVWVLRDYQRIGSQYAVVHIDRHSLKGRKALARYHADKKATMHTSAPRRYRKGFDASIKMHNREILHRWLKHPDFDPVFIDSHRHNANWSWW